MLRGLGLRSSFSKSIKTQLLNDGDNRDFFISKLSQKKLSQKLFTQKRHTIRSYVESSNQHLQLVDYRNDFGSFSFRILLSLRGRGVGVDYSCPTR